MKKHLLLGIVFLSLAGPVWTDDDIAWMNSQRYEKKETPKCVCEDLNATFCYPNGGIKVTGEYLYWSTNYNFPFSYVGTALEESLPVVPPIGTSKINNFNGQIARVKDRWSSGYRVGAWYLSGYDYIDVGFSWTHYQNTSKGKASGINNLITRIFDNSNGDLKLKYNIADFEIGKSYFATSKVLMRPFAGVRAGWLNQDTIVNFHGMPVFDLINANPPTTLAFPTALNLVYDQDLWAVGPRMGVNTSWFHVVGLSIIANVSASLLYGKASQNLSLYVQAAETDENESSMDLKESTFIVGDKTSCVFPTLQVLLGASWERCISKKLSFKLHAGWESNFWWETSNILWVDRPISMQGLTAGASVTF